MPSRLRAADFLNITDVDEVCLEHEFGIFGGPSGSHMLALLRVLPDIIREFPNLVYIGLGQTHPALVREEGEVYRFSLERLAKVLGVQKHVVSFNRFVELEESMRFIRARDI